MKRSEAIQIIGKILTFGKDGFPLDKKQKYKQMSLADIILTELEEAGILPPFIDINSPIGDKDYFTLHVDQAVYVGLCEWEQEEE
jgi:hypothetical protein